MQLFVNIFNFLSKPKSRLITLIMVIFIVFAGTLSAKEVKPLQLPDGYVTKAGVHCDFYFDPDILTAVEPLLETADKHWEEITAFVPVESGFRPKIVVTRTPDEFQSVQPYGAISEWAAGVAYPANGAVILRILNIGDNPSDQLPHILAHELSHLALFSYLEDTEVPRWFSEGLAIYQSGEFSFERFTTIARAAAFGRLIHFNQLDKKWPRDSITAHLAYAQSARFVSYLNERFGPQGIQALINEMHKGKDISSAALMVWGEDINSLESSFFSTLKWYYVIIPLVTGSSFLWFLISVLFVLAYIKHKARQHERMEALDKADSGDWLTQRRKMSRLRLVRSTPETEEFFSSNTADEPVLINERRENNGEKKTQNTTSSDPGEPAGSLKPPKGISPSIVDLLKNDDGDNDDPSRYH